MPSDLNERAEARLANLNNIEPLLGSLRVLSLSSMQMALNRKTNLQNYKRQYHGTLAHILAKLSPRKIDELKNSDANDGKHLLVVLGSERGLCGTYNKNLATLTGIWQSEQIGLVEILSFGTRLHEPLKQIGVNSDNLGSLSSGSKPRYAIANELISSWFEDKYENKLSTIDVLSFRKPAVGFYKPFITRLMPLPMNLDDDLMENGDWPPRIIEGDPESIAKHIIEHLTAIEFYDLILDAITSENAIRYNLLEEAKSNTHDLIEDLSLEIQLARRQMITQQIQEMAAGAGLTR